MPFAYYIISITYFSFVTVREGVTGDVPVAHL